MIVSGTIVLGNRAGRALRKKPAPIRVADVIGCTGGFVSGDAVYVTFRARDGGQFVIATAVAQCAESELSGVVAANDGGVVRDVERIVVREEELKLLWPPGS